MPYLKKEKEREGEEGREWGDERKDEECAWYDTLGCEVRTRETNQDKDKWREEKEVEREEGAGVDARGCETGWSWSRWYWS
jgi:hypothetical protein